jgi:uncharacterized repeat protein (TIGR03803 family)
MKYNRKKAATIFFIVVAMAGVASAQTFKTLVEFDGTDGANPFSTLTQGTDGNYYGTNQFGGNYTCQVPGCGTIFKLSPQGVITTLYTFCAQMSCSDGISPWAALVLGTDGNFYGTTYSGGDPNYSAGTVFKMTPTGTLTTLYQFCQKSACADGGHPSGQLVQGPDGNFYGTTRIGGDRTNCPQGCGTVFRITPNGALTTLHALNIGEGAMPSAGLTLGKDGNFYGTASTGGNVAAYFCAQDTQLGCGTVFRITPKGVVTTLYSFCADGQYCHTDGSSPFAGLILGSDGNFYGAASSQGEHAAGTLFKITPQGQFNVLYNFCSASNCSDGSMPLSTVIQGTDGALYGTASQGGDTNCFQVGLGCGTVFRYSSAGKLTTLHTFEQSDGLNPNGVTQTTKGYFLGTTYYSSQTTQCYLGCGTVFSLSTGLKPFVTFIQNFGKVGQTAQVLGQGFAGVTNVTLNGVQASFTVVSGTFLRFTVPPNATSGFVKVTTPNGVLTSNVRFVVLP